MQSTLAVTIDGLVVIVERIAGVTVKRNDNLAAPLGATRRKSDNAKIWKSQGWEPDVPLRVGMKKSYERCLDRMVSFKRQSDSLSTSQALPSRAAMSGQTPR